MGKKAPKGPETWEPFPEGDKLVTEIVARHHPHLDGLSIMCFGKPEASKQKGRVNVAKAMKATHLIKAALRKHHDRIDYIIVIGLDCWRPMDAKTKDAVIDHELCHFTGFDGDGKLGMRGHDVEEFTEILERHGAWDPSRYYFVKAAQGIQLSLPT